MAEGSATTDLLSALTEELGSSQPLFGVLEQAPFGMLLVDDDQRIAYGNAAACRLMDIDPGGLAERSLSELLGDDFRKRFSRPDGQFLPIMVAEQDQQSDVETDRLERLSRLFSRGHHELTISTFAGMERVVELIEGERIGRFDLWYLLDITARRQLEVELEHRDTFFRNLIDSSVDGIIAADMKGRIILFNSGAQAILGYTREQAFSQLHTSKLYPEGEAREILKRMRSDDFGGRGKVSRHELIAITRDGRQIPMSLSGGIIYSGDKEMATFGIFTDLRAMRKVEEDLEQTHQMLLQSEKMAGLGRLAAGVAHEINNPMSGIMLYANLVLEALGADNPAAADMEIIVHEAERCKQIVADLLEFSHQTSYDQIGVDVVEQVNKALGVLEKQPLFHNIDVALDVEQGLSRIYGNPIRLNQVFMNLIVNAAQAMGGQGRLNIAARHRTNRQIVELVFCDTGPGIPAADLDQVFDPFFTTKHDSGGTGLGLSVSYAIVKEHKGTIRVASESGQGTTFTLRFPALQQEPTGE